MEFPNNGRGVFIYTKKISQGGVVEIYLTLNKVAGKTTPKDDFMRFRINSEGVKLDLCLEGKTEDVCSKKVLAKGSSGLEEGRTASYWISVDRDAFLIKYGKGYVMNETTFHVIDFAPNKKEGCGNAEESTNAVVNKFFSPAEPLYLMVFTDTKQNILSSPMIDAKPAFQFKTRPLAANLRPLVKDSSTVTLFDLDRGEFTFSADLPTACQELYQTLKGCDLEDHEDPEDPIKLSDAMRYSINTKGRCLNKIMEDKKKGSYYTEGHVYIRVTLGPDMRTGPGNPFVLEIWPSGSQSAIHNHGGACGVIKMLFGEMKISIYNKIMDPPADKSQELSSLVDSVEPLMTFDAKQGDFTWMDDNWYQTHTLENITDDFCATVQSYRYGRDDRMQWPGFDYINDNDDSDSPAIFYPQSDITFREMRDNVLQEYVEYLTGNSVNLRS